ncbi:MAG: hypothetical protein HC876_23620 [Chloroflexaceae bacterium]|nr:hypothetical protein [Chloroflexaceae bacterium]
MILFPATLDEFLTMGSRDGALYLGWDESFETIADPDGDELLAGAVNGNDPDDTTWDTDSDGLSDLFELEQQENGYYFDPTDSDSDDDMVPDSEEVLFGSNPANEDSDGDGLYDCEEVYHQLRSSTERANCDSFVASRTGGARTGGGWKVRLGGDGSTQYVVATSDPTDHDSDDDGLNDLAEYDLREKGYHPNVENDVPLAIVSTLLDAQGNEKADFYVGSGTKVTLKNVLSTNLTGSDSATVWNNSLQVDMDDGLGGASKTWNLDIANDENATVTYDLPFLPEPRWHL